MEKQLFLVLLFAGLIFILYADIVLSPDTMIEHDALVVIRVP